MRTIGATGTAVAAVILGLTSGALIAAGDDASLADVAVVFVGHGEPASLADGDAPISFADGTSFGPHATSLGVPPERQSTAWAAAYDEIATAMTYIFGDINHNGVPHELRPSPAGDVPSFFTFEAFYGELTTMYEGVGDHSPHNDLLEEHVASIELDVDGAVIDRHVAFLDAVPRVHDVALRLADGGHDAVVVVPMLLASSTHTQELTRQAEDAAALLGDVEVVVTEPFFEVPLMRDRIRDALVAMAHEMRATMPQDLREDEIGVVLVSHGTPYTPADPALGWQEGEIYSDLAPTIDLFHREVAGELPWLTRTGHTNFVEPTIEDALVALWEADVTHVMVLSSDFPTSAMHTMWDVARAAVDRAVTPDEGIVSEEHFTGMQVYLTALGYADLETGRALFRDGLRSVAEAGVVEALDPPTDE